NQHSEPPPSWAQRLQSNGSAPPRWSAFPTTVTKGEPCTLEPYYRSRSGRHSAWQFRASCMQTTTVRGRGTGIFGRVNATSARTVAMSEETGATRGGPTRATYPTVTDGATLGVAITTASGRTTAMCGLETGAMQ